MKKRISIWRLLFVILVFVGIFYWVFNAVLNTSFSSFVKTKPWFGSYVDVTATPYYAFEDLAGAEYPKNFVLSFIVSSKEDACTPAWGSVYTLDQANVALDLDRRIARTRQQGGHVAISFGGLINDEISTNCLDKDKLKAAYKSVIDRYNIDTIDLDLEGEGLTDRDAMKRRAEVIRILKEELKSEGRSLAVWLTLPVAPFGLTQDGTDAIAIFLAEGVDLAGVNVMTMDYGQSKLDDDSMQKASEKALNETHRQLSILYKNAGINLNSPAVWNKIGATPMIGQNDVIDEVFSLEDAEGFNQFANSKGVGRMSMWSANRDIQCGDNYVNLKIVSDSCSGIEQEDHEFATILGNGFYGNPKISAEVETTESPVAPEIEDDPETSPYQVWSETGTYLQGTKVVWHGNVYESKWWTQGDLPDNPVLQSWETPWQLIGPVLPGETPIPQPTLPAGLYPVWSGTEIYQEGQRVLFNGTPYQAKWWTQGDSPAASTSSPDSSPWAPLTRDQIDSLLD